MIILNQVYFSLTLFGWVLKPIIRNCYKKSAQGRPQALFTLFYFKCGDDTRSCLLSLKFSKYFLIKQAGKARRADLEMERSCERGFGSPWTNFLHE